MILDVGNDFRGQDGVVRLGITSSRSIWGSVATVKKGAGKGGVKRFYVAVTLAPEPGFGGRMYGEGDLGGHGFRKEG